MEMKTIGGDAMGGPDFDFGQTVRGFAVGQVVFSRFRLERMLGRGGMGVVWLARDEKLEESVALKFLPEMVRLDAVALDELKRETRRSRGLNHPHIVRVFDLADDAGSAAIAMEFIDGPTLSALRLERPERCFDAGELRPWLGQLCEALDYAHGTAKVVHRDLKPANLMVDSRGALKITDFGIARSLTDSASRVSVRPTASGTLAYMSPQQLDNEPPRAADDIYALGATLYDLITGKPPFYGGDMPHLIRNKMPPPMTQRRKELGVEGCAEIPPQWEAVVAACLEKEPARRPGSAGEVFGRLEAGGGRREGRSTSNNQHSTTNVQGKTEHGTRKTGKRAGAVMAAGLALMLACGAGWWFGVEKPKREAATAQAAEVSRQERVAGLLAEGEAAVAAKEFAKGRTLYAEAQTLAPGDARLAGALGKLDAAEKEAARLAAARGGVEIATDPPGAEVTVGGVAKGPSPLRQGDLRLGKYPLKIEMKGYDPIEREIAVAENQFANPGMVRLVRSAGTLQIATEPGGQRYEVLLKEGEAAKSELPAGVALSGTTPATLEGLPTGLYSVRLSREGWPNYVGEAKVEAQKVAALSWEFTEGEVALHTIPEGAQWEITCDATGLRRSGVTPASEKLPVGNYRVSFKREGWPEHARDLVLGKGKNPDATWEFAEGSMSLSSDPVGAEYKIFPAGAPVVAEDPAAKTREELEKARARYAVRGLSAQENRELKERIAALEKDLAQAKSAPAGPKPARSGVTPKEEPALPAGDYEVVWQYRDWPEKRTRVTVTKGAKADASAAYQYGGLRIESTPPGAEVFINDKSRGKTPLTIDRLPAGETRVRAKLNGYEAADASTVVLPGNVNSLALSLKVRPFPEGRWETYSKTRHANADCVYSSWIEIRDGRGYYGFRIESHLHDDGYWPMFSRGDRRRNQSPLMTRTKRDFECGLSRMSDNKILLSSDMSPVDNIHDDFDDPGHKTNDGYAVIVDEVGRDLVNGDEIYKKVR